MKTFITYFKDYFKDNFSLVSHLLVLLFIGICIYFNYEYELYRNVFKVKNYSELDILKKWGMFSFAFLVPVGIIAFFQKGRKTILNKNFITFGLISLFLVTIDSSYYLLKYLKEFITNDSKGYSFIYLSLSNICSLISIVLPLFFIYKITKYFKPELYGLKLKKANLKPYLTLIMLMAPIVFIAAFQKDFLNYYPSYKSNSFSSFPLPEILKVSIFEFCYGFDFFSVELLFRGFMVVALSKFVGKDAILPMVACYAFLHFGKPMLETIGSVFGGFALGVLAYKSRNIYGGIIVHLGVAWGMELAAYILLL